MKSIHIKFLLALFVATVALSGCEEDPENITGIVFDENAGVNSGSDVFMNISFTYDTNGNRIVNWNENIGLDVTVRNTNSSLIRNVTLQIESVKPSSVWSDFDSSAKTLGNISGGLSAFPTTYWCFSCDTASEIRIGHFYIQTSSGSGTSNMTVNFRVNYTDGNGRSQIARQTYTMQVR